MPKFNRIKFLKEEREILAAKFEAVSKMIALYSDEEEEAATASTIENSGSENSTDDPILEIVREHKLISSSFIINELAAKQNIRPNGEKFSKLKTRTYSRVHYLVQKGFLTFVLRNRVKFYMIRSTDTI